MVLSISQQFQQLSNGFLSALVLTASALFLLPVGQGHAQDGPQRFALVAGVREYPASEKLPKLPYTEPDANEIAAALKAGGYRVTLMTQTAAQGEGRQRFQPTATFIRKQFNDLVGTPFLKPADCLLVVLEGHGIQLPSKTDPTKLTYYFCPTDAVIDSVKFSEDVNLGHNLISVQELYDTLNQSKAGVKLLVVDACRNDPNKPDAFRSPNSATRPPVPVPPGGMAALFSCSSHQRAVEDSTLKHGVFSYYFIEALSGKADTNQDQQITIGELHEYVGGRVYNFVREKYSRKQLPELSGKVQGVASLMTVPKQSFLKSIGIELATIKPGRYELQEQFAETKRTVKIEKPFQISTHEITVGQFAQFVKDTRYVTEPERATDGASGWDQFEKSFERSRNFSWSKPGFPQQDNHPVVNISQHDATEFCKWLSKEEGRTCRLPTGGEWVYCYGAGRPLIKMEEIFGYTCKNEDTKIGNIRDSKGDAVFGGDFNDQKLTASDGYAFTAPVKSYQSNQWGLYDLLGNVNEFTKDLLHTTYPAPLITGSYITSTLGGSYLGMAGISGTSKANFPYTGFRIVVEP